MADAEKFLWELASRLMCDVIPIPALNSRPEDIPALASHFAQRCAKQLALQALEPLQKVDWQGTNVRGLQNLIESAAARADRSIISEKDVRDSIALHCPSFAKLGMNDEQVMIRNALMDAGGNVTTAAKRIGWSRQKLYRRLKHYGIGSS